MKHHRLRIGEHGLAILALACVTLLLYSMFDATGFYEIFVAPMDSQVAANDSLERIWARVLLIHPNLR